MRGYPNGVLGKQDCTNLLPAWKWAGFKDRAELEKIAETAKKCDNNRSI